MQNDAICALFSFRVARLDECSGVTGPIDGCMSTHSPVLQSALHPKGCLETNQLFVSAAGCLSVCVCVSVYCV